MGASAALRQVKGMGRAFSSAHAFRGAENSSASRPPPSPAGTAQLDGESNGTASSEWTLPPLSRYFPGKPGGSRAAAAGIPTGWLIPIRLSDDGFPSAKCSSALGSGRISASRRWCRAEPLCPPRHPSVNRGPPPAHRDRAGAAAGPERSPPRRLTGRQAQQHRQHPQRPQLHPGARSRAEPSRAEPCRTVPNAGMRNPEGSTALLFPRRGLPLRSAQQTEAPPRAPPYSHQRLDLSPNNSNSTSRYKALLGKIVDQAREANIC